MSMPSFPPCGADMTKDKALAMIVASIAMEELALSHILNAESEKLRYVLGTLPGGPEGRADNQEILAVNKSVTELLNAVMRNQMLLKEKLETALKAAGCPPGPEPPCPCPPGPEPPCPPPPCRGKSAIRLVSRCSGCTWDNGFLLAWKCREQRGRGIRWSEDAPALVGLDPAKTYALDYTINVRNPYHGDGAGAVFVRLTPCDAFSDVLPLYFSAKCPGCEPMTLHCSTVLSPQACPPPWADLSLLLHYGGGLWVERASLSIFEL